MRLNIVVDTFDVVFILFYWSSYNNALASHMTLFMFLIQISIIILATGKDYYITGPANPISCAVGLR